MISLPSNSNHIGEKICLKVFKTYKANISRPWSLTICLDDSEDRRLLCNVIRVKWPRVVSNERACQGTLAVPRAAVKGLF